jgi:hypothetical protein
MSKNNCAGLRWVLAALLAFATWTSAPLAHADCATAVRAELSTFTTSVVQQATLDGKPFSQAKCPDDKQCSIAFFASSKPANAPSQPTGFEPVDNKWTPVGDVKGAKDCKDLWEYLFQRPATTTPTKPKSEAKGDTTKEAPSDAPSARSRDALKKATADRAPSAAPVAPAAPATVADNALSALKIAPHSYTTLTAAGAGQISADDVATEALQILGQIVVDRASAKGYAMIQDKLKTLLDCDPDPSDASKEPKTRFPATCAVIKTLRIQDIAMAPKALANALSLDMLNLLVSRAGMPKIGAQPPSAGAPAATQASVATAARVGAAVVTTPLAPAAPTTTSTCTNPEQVLGDALLGVAIALVTKSGQSQELAVKRALAALTDYVSCQPTVSSLSLAKQEAAYGVLALARCVADSNGTSAGIASCNVEDQLAALSAPDEVKPVASQLAEQLIQIVAAPKNEPILVQLALDTVAETTCMVLLDAAVPTLACPAVETITSLDKVAAVAFAEAFADAALNRDSARFTVLAADVVDLVWDKEQDKSNRRRALRLLAGLLDYAATYAQTPDAQGKTAADDAHQQRTKILESLTEDMSNRTGRTGETVFSLGGALRFVGGVRVATQTSGATFWGPFGLPLGLAMTHISEQGEKGWGFHLEADMVDLGNYLSLDDGPKVAKPVLGDAFAPGLSIGAAYGASMPFVITATGSYTPQFVLNPDRPDKHGSINLGISFGIHVPLIDLN